MTGYDYLDRRIKSAQAGNLFEFQRRQFMREKGIRNRRAAARLSDEITARLWGRPGVCG